MGAFSITPRANADFDEIWDYIAKDDPRAADQVERKLHQAIKLLADVPDIGHRRSDVSDERYRFWVVGRYVIAYRVEHDVVLVIRVVHSARDFRKLFKRR